MGQNSRPWKQKSAGRKKRQKWAIFVTRWMQSDYINRVLCRPWNISNLRHFTPWFASKHLAICVTLPCRLRHFMCSLILFRTLIPYLFPSLRPQMTTLGTISGFARPYEQREERFYTTAHVAKTQNKVNVFLSKSFNKNSNDETLYKGNDIAIDLHDLPLTPPAGASQ